MIADFNVLMNTGENPQKIQKKIKSSNTQLT